MKPLLTKVVSAHDGIVNRLAQGLARRLTGSDVILA
jgi:hypothetical protein